MGLLLERATVTAADGVVVRRTENLDPASASLQTSRRDLISALVAQGRHDEAVLQLRKIATAPDAPRSAWTDLARMLTARKMARRQTDGDWTDVLTGTAYKGTVELEELLGRYPVALLTGEGAGV